jgi:hypothetical protein
VQQEQMAQFQLKPVLIRSGSSSRPAAMNNKDVSKCTARPDFAVIARMPPHASMGGQRSTRLDRHTLTGRQSKGHGKRYIEFAHFSGSKLADVVRQYRFFQANEPIALNGACMLQSFWRTHGNLARQAVKLRKYWSANHGRVR